MSANKGYPRYRRLGPLARWLFNRVSVLCVQDESYADMFRSLGVDPDRIEVTGMMKFDTAPVDAQIPGQAQLAEALGLTAGHRLIVAGGTGPGEEALCRDVFDRLADRHEHLVLAVVPRKPERFDEVARLLGETGRPVVRRSQRPDGSAAPLPAGAVILGDTMGELRAFYALAETIFVGRSLVPMGGSDMIEAAALAKPVAFGPHTFNFPQADALADHGCARVADADALCRQLDTWLSDPDVARAAGERARDHVRSRQGATRRNVEVLCRLLGREPARREGTVATDRIEADTSAREAG
jgi:3-deoxy-D-manno-octulosonic-acid transferase